MDSQPPLIAIVDDEPSVRRALMRLLRSAHYRAEAFDSAAALFSFLSERTAECIVLDLQMPEMTGLELQQRLSHFDHAPPIVVITAYDEPGMRERCFALGAQRYFCKPVDGHVLIESIRQIVQAGARF